MAETSPKLLEQLLQDPVLRERFRRDPVGTARELGLDRLADELALDSADPMETLEPRESRSSLAGVLMAATLEGVGIYEGGHHLLPPVDAAEAATGSGSSNGDGWVFVRAGSDFPGNHPDYAQLRGFGGSGVLWDPDDPNTAAGIASSHQAGLKAGVWLVPKGNETPQAFAQRAADAIAKYHPDRVVLDIEAIGKGYSGSPGWEWSDQMMRAFSSLQPHPPPLAVTVEPLQDDFNYAAYTSRGAQVWPQSYYGDMSPADPKAVVDRVAANGVARDLIVPVLGPRQLDGYGGPHNIYTADDIQGRAPSSSPPSEEVNDNPAPPAARSPNGAVQPAVSTPAPDDASRSPPPARVVDDAAAAQAKPAVEAQAPGQSQVSTNPDDWGGDSDDEDAGADEEDGSDENEPDEDEPDGGGDSDDGDDSDDGSDDDQDAPGEGSNGEDANDDSSDGDSSDDDSSDDDSSDSSDSSGDGGSDASDGSDATGTPDLSAVDSSYPGDNAPRADIAAWMGSEAQKRGLPPELPVMASLTESTLRNLNYGDADSVGFFQMRTSIWDQGAYRGYAQKPELQLKWFLDQAESVKKQRLAHGQSVTDPKQYGNWIADIERPAEQYRGRYQLRFDEARQLLAAHAEQKHGAGSAAEQVADATTSVTAGPRAEEALGDAKKFLGTPYRWGGSSPSTGFDCSGLVQYVYAKVGIHIPRVTDQQILASNGTPVDRKHLLPGDLVFFRDSTGYVHHVGISLGGDKFVHAPHTGDVVKISSLKEQYYAQQFTGGRRFVPAVSSGSGSPVVNAATAAEQRSHAEAIRIAQAALERDAADVQRPGSALALALERQERRNEELRNAVQFIRAVDPSLVRRAK